MRRTRTRTDKILITVNKKKNISQQKMELRKGCPSPPTAGRSEQLISADRMFIDAGVNSRVQLKGPAL